MPFSEEESQRIAELLLNEGWENVELGLRLIAARIDSEPLTAQMLHSLHFLARLRIDKNAKQPLRVLGIYNQSLGLMSQHFRHHGEGGTGIAGQNELHKKINFLKENFKNAYHVKLIERHFRPYAELYVPMMLRFEHTRSRLRLVLFCVLAHQTDRREVEDAEIAEMIGYYRDLMREK